MKANRLFEPTSAEIARLIADHPFAQMVSSSADAIVCTPLPLLLEEGDGSAWLVGHFATSNPHVALLRERPRALAVFTGAHGYVSPSWMRDRTQAPTWNFETVHVDIEVELDESGGAPHVALARLVEHMERGRVNAWSSHELGARYDKLSAMVVAFRARVLGIQGKFKLGQNEREDVYRDILEALDRNGQTALAAAMRRANACW